ncbi:MAG: BON domain-containing protein [Gaiellaceae bacterium]
MLRLLFYGALGAAFAYFFDPENGRRRRALTRDRVPALFRSGARRAEQVGRAAQSEAYGAAQKVKHLKEEQKPQPDDVTLARKVETEIFRDADVPKGQINVNAEDGVVVLRGEVEQPELIKDLEKKTRKVQGVREVENLLHAPGTPAPTK